MPTLLLILAMGLVGCNDRIGIDPPPLPPSVETKKNDPMTAASQAQASSPKATAIPARTVRTSARSQKRERLVRTRFLVEAPAGEAMDPRSLQAIDAHVQLGEEKPIPVQAMNRRQARQGMAVLIVLPMPKVQPGWKDAIRKFIDQVGPWDTVAVGVVDHRGFRLIQSFSADPLSTIAAIGSLPTIDSEEEQQRLKKRIPLYRGLLESLDSFRKGQLPELRSLVLLSDGTDRTIRRSSARERVERFIRQRAQTLGVRLSWVITTADAQIARMRTLILDSGGDVVQGFGDDDALDNAWKRLGQLNTQWVVVEHTTTMQPSGSIPVTVTVDFRAGRVRAQKDVRFSKKRKLGVRTIDIGLPAPPNTVLPPGVNDSLEIVKQAETAQAKENWLTAGALWHLAALAMPENRAFTTRAALMDTSFVQSPQLPGSVVFRSKDMPIGVNIEKKPSVFPSIWRDILQSERDAAAVLSPAPTDTAALPPNQIILWATEQSTAEGCARELLVSERATHLFMASNGQITQLADLSARVKYPDNASPRAIHMHVYVPNTKSATWQDPTDPATWRHPRLRRPALEVNDVRDFGWSLTMSQTEALTRVLGGLTSTFRMVKPVFPVRSNGKPAVDRILNPDQYSGLISSTCLDDTSLPALARALEYPVLNISVQRYSPRSKSTNMENWLDDLANAKRVSGAVARFAHIGEQAIPLLEEAAIELKPEQGIGAIRALVALQTNKVVKSLLTVVQLGVGESASDAATQRTIHAAQALVQYGNAAHIGTLERLAALARQQLGADSAAVLHFEELHAALIAATATTAQLPTLDNLLRSSRASIRAQAVLALSRLEPQLTKPRLQQALADESAWVRLFAVHAIGPEAQTLLPELVQDVGLPAVVRTLGSWKSTTPLTEALSWFAEGNPAVQDMLGDIFIRWRWRLAIDRLAPNLRKVSPGGQERILRILRGITERDFGSAPDRYLEWVKG